MPRRLRRLIARLTAEPAPAAAAEPRPEALDAARREILDGADPQHLAALVHLAYAMLLERPPDTDGLSYHLDRLRQGYPLELFVADMVRARAAERLGADGGADSDRRLVVALAALLHGWPPDHPVVAALVASVGEGRPAKGAAAELVEAAVARRIPAEGRAELLEHLATLLLGTAPSAELLARARAGEDLATLLHAAMADGVADLSIAAAARQRNEVVAHRRELLALARRLAVLEDRIAALEPRASVVVGTEARRGP